MGVGGWWGTRCARLLGAGSLAAAAGLAAPACEVVTAPPANAQRMEALPDYATWWTEVEACSRLSGDFASIEWYEVPADPDDGGFFCKDAAGESCAGEWSEPHSIYLAGPSAVYPSGYVADEWTVKHEMLHDLVGRPGHPEQFDYCHLRTRSPTGVSGQTH